MGRKSIISLIVVILAIGLIGGYLITHPKINSSKSIKEKDAKIAMNYNEDRKGKSQKVTNNKISNSKANTSANNGENSINSNNVNLNNIKNSTNIAEKPFYGKWRIERILCHGPVQAMNKIQAQQYINKTIIYDKEMVMQGNVVINNPVYEESSITANKFLNDNMKVVNFKDIGVDGNNAVLITINNSKLIWGNNFYINSKGNLVVYINGYFFEMKKLSN